MFPEKLLINLLVYGWRVFRLIFLGGGWRAPAVQTAIVEEARNHRGNYGNGLAWMTALALLLIGLPLANTDPAFKTAAGTDIQALWHEVANMLDLEIHPAAAAPIHENPVNTREQHTHDSV
jgi:hypothetical protein